MAYCKFGDNLIDFAYNGCVIAPTSDTEQNALRARYGSDEIDRWLQIGTVEIPLKTEKLQRVETGISLGMTLDFMEQYLQQIQSNIPPMEAIRKISSQYVTGAPDRAQLAQIFYTALDLTTMIEREWVSLNASLQKRREDSISWFNNQLDLTLSLPREQQFEEITRTETRARELLSHFWRETLSTRIKSMVQIEAQRWKIVSHQFGLQVGPAQIYVCEKLSTGDNAALSQFLEGLPNGCYAGTFLSEECAHAITLIKASDNQYFLFEPNVGTLVFVKNEIAENLLNIGRLLHFENKACTLSFSSCRLE